MPINRTHLMTETKQTKLE